MEKILLILNLLIGICAVAGIGYNIIKTHVLTHNHINHLTVDVKTIFKKLEEIDRTQDKYGELLAGIQSTCKERGKQLDKLQG